MINASRINTRRVRLSLGIAIAITTCMALAGGAVAVASDAPSATGSGHFQVDGGLRSFAFSAVTQRDGSVTGQAQLDNRGQRVSEHLSIDCLVVSGNIAYASGTITGSSDPSIVGQSGVFSVQDNGEGSHASPDQISLVYRLSPTAGLCHWFQPTPDQQIDGWNIQVHS